MRALSKLIEDLRISQAVKLTASGSKRAKDIQESFDICINIVMDFATQFENELKKERVKAYNDGINDGRNEMRSKLNNIVEQIEDL